MKKGKEILQFLDMIVATFLWAGSIRLHAPGYALDDTIELIKSARAIYHGVGEFRDLNPPAMSLVIGFFDNLGHPLLGMLILHQTLFWVGLVIIGRALFPKVLWPRLLLLAVGFFPPVLGISGAILKDVSYANSILFAFALILLGRKSDARSKYLLWLALIPLVYATLVRTNGILGTWPFFIWIANLFFPGARLWKSIGYGTAFALIVIIGNRILTKNVFHAISHHLEQQLYTYDMLGIAQSGVEIVIPSTAMWSPPKTLDQLKKLYNPKSSSYLYALRPVEELLKESGNKAVVKDLQRRWIDSIKEYPIPYLKHRWHVTQLLLGLTEETSCWPIFDKMGNNSMGFSFSPTKAHRWLFEKVDKFSSSWIFRGYLYLMAAALVFIFALKRRSIPLLVLTSSALFYSLPYFVISLGCDFRYVYPSILLTIIVLFVFCSELGAGGMLSMRKIASSEL
jgi:hypothetical protein